MSHYFSKQKTSFVHLHNFVSFSMLAGMRHIFHQFINDMLLLLFLTYPFFIQQIINLSL